MHELVLGYTTDAQVPTLRLYSRDVDDIKEMITWSDRLLAGKDVEIHKYTRGVQFEEGVVDLSLVFDAGAPVHKNYPGGAITGAATGNWVWRGSEGLWLEWRDKLAMLSKTPGPGHQYFAGTPHDECEVLVSFAE